MEAPNGVIPRSKNFSRKLILQPFPFVYKVRKYCTTNSQSLYKICFKKASVPVKIICAVLLCFFILSCAFISNKSGDWAIKIRSFPKEADISIFDDAKNIKIFVGQTPTILKLSSKGGFYKGKSYTVHIQKEGYETKTLKINSTLNAEPLAGNSVFSLAPSDPSGFSTAVAVGSLLIVDPVAGTMWKLEPYDINVTLEPISLKPEMTHENK